MVVVYKRADKIAAQHVDTQDELERVAFEIGVRAEERLIEHKQDGDAQILLLHGDIDHYVVLDDSRGLDAALSIEFGRAGYIDPDTGEVYGAMEPLYILTEAANLPRKGKRLPIVKKRKPKAKRKRKKKGVTELGGSTT